MINRYKFHPKLFTPNNEVKIVVFADTHIGNPYANLEKLQSHIDMVRDTGAYWVHLGDWCEMIDATDVRYTYENRYGLTIPIQYLTAIRMFEPIKDQCLGILCGNHDRPRQSTSDWAHAIAMALQIPYLGYRGFIMLGLTNQEKYLPKEHSSHFFKMFLWHGNGGGITIGSKATKISRLSHTYMANLYLMGHHHTPLYYDDAYYFVGLNAARSQKYVVREGRRHYMVAPSYLETTPQQEPATDYRARKGLSGQRTGCAIITLRGYQQEIFTEHLEERLTYLRPFEIKRGVKTPAKKRGKRKYNPYQILVKPEFIYDYYQPEEEVKEE